MASSKKLTKKQLKAYRNIAHLLHELTCDDRDECTYGDDFTTVPRTNGYHCQRAVISENLAAAIVRLWL